MEISFFILKGVINVIPIVFGPKHPPAGKSPIKLNVLNSALKLIQKPILYKIIFSSLYIRMFILQPFKLIKKLILLHVLKTDLH